jgi:WD40 repeat protein
MPGHAGSVRAIAYCEEADLIVSAGFDTSIRFADITIGVLRLLYLGCGVCPRDTAIEPSKGPSALLCCVVQTELVRHKKTITCLAIDCAAKLLVSGSQDCIVKGLQNKASGVSANQPQCGHCRR